MSTYSEEDKTKIIGMYLAQDPTPETSIEIIKDIATELDKSPNGIRMILVQAGKYVKKAESSGSSTSKSGTSAKSGEGTKRVSKESQVAELKAAIEAKGKEVDEDILSKLTGKAAAYITSLLKD